MQPNNVFWNLTGKASLEKHLTAQEEMLMSSPPTTLHQIVCKIISYFFFILKSIKDPDGNLKGTLRHEQVKEMRLVSVAWILWWFLVIMLYWDVGNYLGWASLLEFRRNVLSITIDVDTRLSVSFLKMATSSCRNSVPLTQYNRKLTAWFVYCRNCATM